MTVEIPEGFGQFTFRWSAIGASGEIDVVMGMKPVTSGPDGQAMADLGSTVAGAHLNALAPEGHSYNGCTLLWRVAAGLFRFDSVAGAIASVGTGSNALPPSMCILVKKLTGQAGRQFRGRMYLPAPPTSVLQQGGSMLGTAARDSMQEALNSFLIAPATGAADATFAWYLLHGRKKLAGDAPGHPTGPLPVPTFITGFTVEPKLATQRGRLRD